MSKRYLKDFAFVGLCISIFISLNSLTYELFKVKQVASPLILLFCLLIIINTKIIKNSFKHNSIILLYSIFFFYYIIGFIVRITNDSIDYQTKIFDQIQFFVTSLIIIFSVHQYIFHELVINKREKKVFNFFYIPIILSSIYAIYQNFSGQLIIEGTENIKDRAAGVFGNPNELGVIANMGLLFTFYSLYAHKKFILLKIILIPSLLYVSFLSLSRASLITSSMIIILNLILFALKFSKNPRSIRKKFLIVGGLPIILITYLIINFESILIKYTDEWQAKKIITIVDLIFKGKINTETTSERSTVINYSFQWIKENPVFGNGLGLFSLFPDNIGIELGVHNTYLLVLGDSGILAFLIFDLFIIYILFKSLKLKSFVLSFISFGAIMIWALQCMSGHNGLSDKTFNILITVGVLYLIYGLSQENYIQRNAYKNT